MKKNLLEKTSSHRMRRHAALRFTPTAWAKLLTLRDVGDTEIGGFGISAPDDLLLVEDIALVTQRCTWSQVTFDDEAVADFFDAQVAAGRQPEEFARIWLHTHPGSSAEPSGTDESTFARVFGTADWAVMFILARGGQTFARLRYNVGPGADVTLAVEVDFQRPFGASNHEPWKQEYTNCVQVPPAASPTTVVRQLARLEEFEPTHSNGWHDNWNEYANFELFSEEGQYGFIRDF